MSRKINKRKRHARRSVKRGRFARKTRHTPKAHRRTRIRTRTRHVAKRIHTKRRTTRTTRTTRTPTRSRRKTRRRTRSGSGRPRSLSKGRRTRQRGGGEYTKWLDFEDTLMDHMVCNCPTNKEGKFSGQCMCDFSKKQDDAGKELILGKIEIDMEEDAKIHKFLDYAKDINWALVMAMLREDPSLIDKTRKNRKTALHQAIEFDCESSYDDSNRYKEILNVEILVPYLTKNTKNIKSKAKGTLQNSLSLIEVYNKEDSNTSPCEYLEKVIKEPESFIKNVLRYAYVLLHKIKLILDNFTKTEDHGTLNQLMHHAIWFFNEIKVETVHTRSSFYDEYKQFILEKCIYERLKDIFSIPEIGPRIRTTLSNNDGDELFQAKERAYILENMKVLDNLYIPWDTFPREHPKIEMELNADNKETPSGLIEWAGDEQYHSIRKEFFPNPKESCISQLYLLKELPPLFTHILKNPTNDATWYDRISREYYIFDRNTTLSKSCQNCQTEYSTFLVGPYYVSIEHLKRNSSVFEIYDKKIRPRHTIHYKDPQIHNSVQVYSYSDDTVVGRFINGTIVFPTNENKQDVNGVTMVEIYVYLNVDEHNVLTFNKTKEPSKTTDIDSHKSGTFSPHEHGAAHAAAAVNMPTPLKPAQKPTASNPGKDGLSEQIVKLLDHARYSEWNKVVEMLKQNTWLGTLSIGDRHTMMQEVIKHCMEASTYEDAYYILEQLKDDITPLHMDAIGKDNLSGWGFLEKYRPHKWYSQLNVFLFKYKSNNAAGPAAPSAAGPAAGPAAGHAAEQVGGQQWYKHKHPDKRALYINANNMNIVCLKDKNKDEILGERDVSDLDWFNKLWNNYKLNSQITRHNGNWVRTLTKTITERGVYTYNPNNAVLFSKRTFPNVSNENEHAIEMQLIRFGDNILNRQRTLAEFNKSTVDRPILPQGKQGIKFMSTDSVANNLNYNSKYNEVFVLPSQLNSAEYQTHENYGIVVNVEGYDSDPTGGPEGQLACDWGVAQFIIDNARNSNRETGLDNVPFIEHIPSISLKNGYLEVKENIEETEIQLYLDNLKDMTILMSKNIVNNGWNRKKKQPSNGNKHVALVYASAIPMGEDTLNVYKQTGNYTNLIKVANITLYGQYVCSMNAACEYAISQENDERTRLYLMPLGGGAFQNKRGDIVAMIKIAYEDMEQKLQDNKVDVIILWQDKGEKHAEHKYFSNYTPQLQS